MEHELKTTTTTEEVSAADGTATSAGEAVSSTDETDDEQASISIRMETVEARFSEGFEVGLRILGAGGEVIDEVLWTDYVTRTGDGSIESFYTSRYTATVPQGQVVVQAQTSVGSRGLPPYPVDVKTELRCQLVIDTMANTAPLIEVVFGDVDDCLRLIDQ